MSAAASPEPGGESKSKGASPATAAPAIAVDPISIPAADDPHEGEESPLGYVAPPPAFVPQPPYALDAIFSFKQISVVESFDFVALSTTLKWIVDQLGANEDLVALQHDNADMRAHLNALKDRQDALDSNAQDAAIESVAQAEAALQEQQAAMQEQQAAMQEHTAALEEALSQTQEQQAQMLEQQAAMQDQIVAQQAEIELLRATLPEDLDVRFAALEDGAVKANEALNHMATHDTTDDLMHRILEAQEDTQKKLGAKADIEETAELRTALAAKASLQALEDLAERLHEKAEKSEVDALIKFGGNFGGADHSGGPLMSEGETLDLKGVTDLARRISSEVQSMRGLLAVMQDRLQNKADTTKMEDMRKITAGLRESVNYVEQAVLPVLPKIDMRLVSQESGMLDLQRLMAGGMPARQGEGGPAGQELRRRLEALEVRAAEHMAAAPALAAARAMQAMGAYASSPALDDLQPALTEIYTVLAGKSDKGMLDLLTTKVQALTKTVEGKAEAGQVAELYGQLDRKANETDMDLLERKMRALQKQLEAGGGGGGGGGGGSGPPVDLGPMEAIIKKLQAELATKANTTALDAMSMEMELKGDAEKLDALEVNLLGRASTSALDDLVLRVAMLTPGSVQDGVPADGTSALLSAVKAMVADKASRNELDGFKVLLAHKAGREELNTLHNQMADKASLGDMNEVKDTKANQDALAAVSMRVAALAQDFANILDRKGGGVSSSTPLDNLLSQSMHILNPGDSEDLMRMVSALARELQSVKDSMDVVAHAANILAVGQDNGSNGLDGGAGRGLRSAAGGVPAGANGQREGKASSGAVERLGGLLGGGDVGFKMNAFDPEILHRMAQKLSTLEAAVRNPAYAARLAQASAPDVGMRDLENKMRRLAGDMRTLRDTVSTATGGAHGTAADMGDHAILAAKPVGGYRCMACDRPLDKLDDAPGKYIPSRKLPVMVPAATDAASKQVAGLIKTERTTISGVPSMKKTHAADAAANAGPQNWYGEGKGASAMDLPREDVGPHLPKGGWRGSEQHDKANLPEISQGGRVASPRVSPNSPPRNRPSDNGGYSGGGAQPASLPAIT